MTDVRDFDIIDMLKSVNKFLSFNPHESSYSYNFEEVDSNISDNVKSTIIEILEDKNVNLLARGDSFQSHDDFIENRLMDFFIVGDKAKLHFNEGEKSFELYGKNFAKNESIKKTATLCNIILNDKHKEDLGQIKDEAILKILNMNDDEKIEIKAKLLALIHTSGKEKKEKNVSPYISFTYGKNMCDIAKGFALRRSKANKGVIYLYMTNEEDSFIYTKELRDFLLSYGVYWYDDKNNELMLLNAAFPHKIIGFFEILEPEINFIINPWFYLMIKKNMKFSFKRGIFVNQKNFDSSYRRLGGKTFVTRSKNGDVKIKQLDGDKEIESPTIPKNPTKLNKTNQKRNNPPNHTNAE